MNWSQLAFYDQKKKEKQDIMENVSCLLLKKIILNWNYRLLDFRKFLHFNILQQNDMHFFVFHLRGICVELASGCIKKTFE